MGIYSVSSAQTKRQQPLGMHSVSSAQESVTAAEGSALCEFSTGYQVQQTMGIRSVISAQSTV